MYAYSLLFSPKCIYIYTENIYMSLFDISLTELFLDYGYLHDFISNNFFFLIIFILCYSSITYEN